MNDVVLLKKYCQSLNVLYVEDEKELNETMSRYLSKFFNHVEAAYDGNEGLEKYREDKFDIVLTDINMPKMNGIDMASQIRSINPEQEIIIISAHTETDYFLNAIHLGITDYVLKPIIYEQMNSVLYKIANVIHIRQENNSFHESLHLLVKEQTLSLTDNYEQTITAMVDLVESRDTYTGGHSERVAAYSKAIAKEMKLSDEESELVYRAGMLHDIGKVTTPDSILLKPGKLSEIEHDLIKNHVTVSYELLLKIPMYAKLSQIVISHHERYDGYGYPNGLKGNEIPLLGQIMIIADAFDSMTTNRIYKGRMSREDAIVEIQKNSGTQFDPNTVPYACKALSHVVISQSITQLPKSSMENERFAYFFHDTITECYNKEYLELFLQQNIQGTGDSSCACFLKNFSQYNKKFGWEKGDALLKDFADHLRNINPNALIFRVHGDDFVLISQESSLECSKESLNPVFLNNTEVDAVCYALSFKADIMTQITNIEEGLK